MTIQEALEKLQSYEKATFALNHATGLMYYDGATTAPKGTAELRGSTLGELSRMGYELTTAPETVEMLRTLMENREELDPVTRRKAEELWRDYDRTHRVPVAEYVAYQELSAKSDAVWHEAKEKNDFTLFEPYLQQMFDASRRMAGYWEPEKDPYLCAWPDGGPVRRLLRLPAGEAGASDPAGHRPCRPGGRRPPAPGLSRGHPAPVLRLHHGCHGHRSGPLHHRRDGAPLHHQLLP